MNKYIVIALLSTMLALSGCSTYSRHPNAIGGAAVGGAIGAAATGNPAGAAAGAAIGAGVGSMADDMYPRRGRPGYGAAGGYRAAPCEPFEAGALMDWATELDNPHQKRTARVSNSNGRVQCYSSESAGSGYGSRRGGSQDPRYEIRR